MPEHSEIPGGNQADVKNKEIKGMFDGNILPLIIKLAIPIFLGLIVQLIYNITDVAWISIINPKDPSYVGGTGLVFPIIFFASALASGLSIGVTSLVARAIGEKNYTVLNKTAESGLAIAVSISIVLIIFFYLFTDQAIRFLGAEGDYFVHAKEYLLYIIPAAVVLFMMDIFMGILQGEGRMKYVMIASIIGTVGNIILDPIFIFVFKMGVGGAALATTISQAFSCLYIIAMFLKGKSVIKIEFHLRNISSKVIKQILSIGVPQSLSMILASFSFLIFNRIIISIDPTGVTAFSLTGRFDQGVLMPVYAVSYVLVTVIGQNAGRGLFDRVKQIWYKSIILGAGCTAVIALVMVLLAPVIYGGFTDVPSVLRYAVLQTWFTEFSFIFAAIGALAGSAFQAIGYPVPALITLIMRLVGFNFPVILLFVYVLRWNMYGVWFGSVLGNILGAAISFFWFNSYLKRICNGQLKIHSTHT